ncbi:MAG: DUF5671 domain-containing protein [Patescibacteria group bacterium]
MNQPLAPGAAKVTPKDFFLHLFAIVMLYAAAANVLVLAFQYVNALIPDQLGFDGDFYLPGVHDRIRGALAAVIITFPAYFAASFALQKTYRAEPAKAGLRVRKWLTYFTLFVAAVVIVGDLVALLNRFLEGDLTAKFILKTTSVFLVAAVIFAYYLWEIKFYRVPEDTPRRFPRNILIFIGTVSTSVVALVVAGFFIAGSPKEARLLRFDDRRIQDLQSTQSWIIDYWKNKSRLPEKLDDLRDDIQGIRVPVDPATGASYTYEVTGPLSFTLCAEFARPSSADAQGRYPKMATPYPVGQYYGEETWAHEAGKSCFRRTIDPEVYKPQREMENIK